MGDDPNGKLFAKVREGLDKWLERRGIMFAGVWARERQCRGQSDVEHCHLLFHLPGKYRTGKKLLRATTPSLGELKSTVTKGAFQVREGEVQILQNRIAVSYTHLTLPTTP